MSTLLRTTRMPGEASGFTPAAFDELEQLFANLNTVLASHADLLALPYSLTYRHNVTVQTVTSSTSEKDLYREVIEANVLTISGDALEVIYAGRINCGGGRSSTLTAYINNQSLALGTLTTTYYDIHAWIVRTSPSEVTWTIRTVHGSASVDTVQTTLIVPWTSTAANTVRLTATMTNAADVTDGRLEYLIFHSGHAASNTGVLSAAVHPWLLGTAGSSELETATRLGA